MLLQGKVGLIFGIANDRSYATHIAAAIIAQGGKCAFPHLPGEKNERRTRKAVEGIGVSDPWLFPCDAGKDEELDAVFDAYAKSFNRMDFLVHSIAFADREWLAPGKFTDTPRAAYLSAIDISAYTLAAMARRARPMMRDSGGGSIMCMSYYGAEKVVSGYNVMGVAKAALEASMRYLASELGPRNIRVNAISAGPIKTASARGIKGLSQILEHAAEVAPLRRSTDPAEVADAAVFLASDLGRGVTGNVMYVDSGYHIMGY